MREANSRSRAMFSYICSHSELRKPANSAAFLPPFTPAHVHSIVITGGHFYNK